MLKKKLNSQLLCDREGVCVCVCGCGCVYKWANLTCLTVIRRVYLRSVYNRVPSGVEVPFNQIEISRKLTSIWITADKQGEKRMREKGREHVHGTYCGQILGGPIHSYTSRPPHLHSVGSFRAVVKIWAPEPDHLWANPSSVTLNKMLIMSLSQCPHLSSEDIILHAIWSVGEFQRTEECWYMVNTHKT